jgi:hydrogenase/urease accessory protein HupE
MRAHDMTTSGGNMNTSLSLSVARRVCVAAALTLAAGVVQAHEGHGAQGLAAGLVHPFAGVDHLLAMIAVGLWSAAVLPAAPTGCRALRFFLVALLAGAFIGVQTGAGVAGAYIEAGVALSVTLFGALLLARRQLPVVGGLALVAAAGALHGVAHGAEWSAGTSFAGYAAGFMLGSALLHAAGLAAGAALARVPAWAWRVQAAAARRRRPVHAGRRASEAALTRETTDVRHYSEKLSHATGIDEGAVAHGRSIKSVYVYEAPVRIWHWINALAITVLALTGYFIGSPLPTQPGEASANYLMGYIRFAHFAAGYILAVGLIGRTYWAIVGNHHARELYWVPLLTRAYWVEVLGMLKWYAFISPRPGRYVGHNPLARFAMFFGYLVLTVFMI